MRVAVKVKDLEVYVKAYQLQQIVFELSKKFPPEEKYSLTDQVRRSSRSVGANICEAWRKRRYVAHFTSKLTDSDGEQEETCHWLRTAVSCGYVETAVGQEVAEGYEHVSAMLNSMINNAGDWCREPSGKQRS